MSTARTVHLLAPLLLGTALMAQSSWLTFPNYYTLHEAPGSSDLLASPMRFQQVIGDWRGAPYSVRALLLRRDGITPRDPRFAPRTLTLEVVMSHGDRGTTTGTFANNYKTPPTVVLPQTTFSTPDLTEIGNEVPTAPWNFNLMFQTPFAYSGAQDLLYEIRLYGTSAPAVPLALDAADQSGIAYGRSLVQGTGCPTPLGQMTLRSLMRLDAATAKVTFAYAVASAPATSPLALLVGATNPNQLVPGLCARVMTDSSVVIPGATDANGSFLSPLQTIPVPALFFGLTLYAQAAAPLAGAPGIPVVLSNGLRSGGMATPPTTLASTTVFGAGSAQVATGSVAPGTALVTTFEYQ